MIAKERSNLSGCLVLCDISALLRLNCALFVYVVSYNEKVSVRHIGARGSLEMYAFKHVIKFHDQKIFEMNLAGVAILLFVFGVLVFSHASFIPCALGAEPSGKIVLNKTMTYIYMGDSEQLIATIVEGDISIDGWTSSNTYVATVDDEGLVTTHREGTAIITVWADNGNASATCIIHVFVLEVPVTGVMLNKTSMTLSVGETEQLIATITPNDATLKEVDWTASDPTIATVDTRGLVRAVAAGTTIITVTTLDGDKIASCVVTVLPSAVPATGVTLNKTSLTLSVGGIEQLIATVAPSDATVKAVTWVSSNPTVATVDATGKVTARAAGSATITATTVDGGKTASCVLTVLSSAVSVTGVSLSKTSLTLNVGGTEQLVATVSPSDATNKAVTWVSSNPAVATVDATGKVTARTAGSATITATTIDGLIRASCIITVIDQSGGTTEESSPLPRAEAIAATAASTTKTYTIKFYNGSTLIATMVLPEGSQITFQTTKTGYTFVGWYTANTGGTKVTKVTKNQSLYARFTINYYTVKYFIGTTSVATKSLKYGSAITSGYTAPAKTGHTFSGWFTAASGGSKVSTVTKTQNVYARYTPISYTIKYYDGTTLLATKSVAYGKLITSGYTFMKTGYTFTGWYTAAVAGSKVTTVTKNQSVYAHYSVNYYSIKYYDGATLKATKSLAYGSSIASGYTAPTKTGHTFSGWYTAASGGSKVTTVTKNQSVYARYAAKSYSVNYYSRNSLTGNYTTLTSKNVLYGTQMTAGFAGPSRPDCNFIGWYTAYPGGTRVDIVTQNQSVYARHTFIDRGQTASVTLNGTGIKGSGLVSRMSQEQYATLDAYNYHPSNNARIGLYGRNPELQEKYFTPLGLQYRIGWAYIVEPNRSVQHRLAGCSIPGAATYWWAEAESISGTAAKIVAQVSR